MKQSFSKKEDYKKLFPYSNNLDKIKVNKVGLYSLSKAEEDIVIQEILKNAIKIQTKSMTVTDATGGIGGASIIFSRLVKKVYVYEKDIEQYNCLVSNLGAHSFTKNVKAMHGDYLKNIDTQVQDLVFIDPPWGGPGYKQKKGIILRLNDTTMTEIVNTLVGKTKYVIIKVPFNFDFNNFTNTVITNKIIIYKVKNYFVILVDLVKFMK